MKPLSIEYIMIYTDAGIPVYSHCFSSFCRELKKTETLLMGFLSALSIMNDVFSSERIYTIEHNDITMVFYEIPCKKTIVIGVNTEIYNSNPHNKVLLQLFKDIQMLFESKYKDFKWGAFNRRKYQVFEQELEENYIRPFFVKNGINNNCEYEKSCGLRTSGIQSLKTKSTLMQGIKKVYQRIKA